jgi:hypothetical protein
MPLIQGSKAFKAMERPHLILGKVTSDKLIPTMCAFQLILEED